MRNYGKEQKEGFIPFEEDDYGSAESKNVQKETKPVVNEQKETVKKSVAQLNAEFEEARRSRMRNFD